MEAFGCSYKGMISLEYQTKCVCVYMCMNIHVCVSVIIFLGQRQVRKGFFWPLFQRVSVCHRGRHSIAAQFLVVVRAHGGGCSYTQDSSRVTHLLQIGHSFHGFPDLPKWYHLLGTKPLKHKHMWGTLQVQIKTVCIHTECKMVFTHAH